jgi:L-fucose mutarotase
MTILKGIPKLINPQLLSALARMGHGDEIVFADANFPSASVAKSTTLGSEIRMDGTGIPDILAAVMKLFPLDPVARNAAFMEMMPEHKAAGWKTCVSRAPGGAPAHTLFYPYPALPQADLGRLPRHHRCGRTRRAI